MVAKNLGCEVGLPGGPRANGLAEPSLNFSLSLNFLIVKWS